MTEKIGLKEAFFFRMWKKLFWQKRLGNAVIIQLTWELVRLKAYNLKLILDTNYMVMWRSENFLQPLEVGWVWFWEAQKLLKNMDFGCLRTPVRKGCVWGLPKFEIEQKFFRNVGCSYEKRWFPGKLYILNTLLTSRSTLEVPVRCYMHILCNVNAWKWAKIALFYHMLLL